MRCQNSENAHLGLVISDKMAYSNANLLAISLKRTTVAIRGLYRYSWCVQWKITGKSCNQQKRIF